MSLKVSGSRWLLFADELGVAARVADRLASANHDVILVKAGERFDRDDDDRFTIDPANSADYRALLQALNDANRAPHVIGHFWSVTDESAAESPDAGAFHENASGAALG